MSWSFSIWFDEKNTEHIIKKFTALFRKVGNFKQDRKLLLLLAKALYKIAFSGLLRLFFFQLYFVSCGYLTRRKNADFNLWCIFCCEIFVFYFFSLLTSLRLLWIINHGQNRSDLLEVQKLSFETTRRVWKELLTMSFHLLLLSISPFFFFLAYSTSFFGCCSNYCITFSHLTSISYSRLDTGNWDSSDWKFQKVY